jgi:SAM-dependent methyltransferase
VAVLRGKHLLRCEDCTAYYFAERPTQEEIKTYYQGAYSEIHQQQLHDLLRGQYEAGFFKDQVQNMLAYHGGRQGPTIPGRSVPFRVLDFGCGPGYFLKACLDRRIEAYGVEHDPQVARFNQGLGIRMLTLEQLAALPDSFLDCVRANHVIEHLQEPRVALNLFLRKLRVGGVVLISTPCFSPALVRKQALLLYDLVYPDHLFYFTCQAFQRMLESLGYVPEVNVSQFAAPWQGLRMLGVDAQNPLPASKCLAPEELRAVQTALETEPFKAGSNLFIVARKPAVGSSPRLALPECRVSLAVSQPAVARLLQQLAPPVPLQETKHLHISRGPRGQHLVVDWHSRWYLLWSDDVDTLRGASQVEASGCVTVLHGQEVAISLLGADLQPLPGLTRTFLDNDRGDFAFRWQQAARRENGTCQLCMHGTGPAELFLQDIVLARHRAEPISTGRQAGRESPVDHELAVSLHEG